MWKTPCWLSHSSCYNNSCLTDSTKYLVDYVRQHKSHPTGESVHHPMIYCNRVVPSYRESHHPGYPIYCPSIGSPCSWLHSRLGKYGDMPMSGEKFFRSTGLSRVKYEPV